MLINILFSSSFLFIYFFGQPNPARSMIDEPTVGKALLRSRGMYTEDYMYWICILALLGFSLLFNLCFIAALTYLNRKYCFSCQFPVQVFNNFGCDNVLNLSAAFGETKSVIMEDNDRKKNRKLLSSTSGQRAPEMSPPPTAPLFEGY